MSDEESRLTRSSIIRGAQSDDDFLREDAWVHMTGMFGPLVHQNVRRAGVPTSDIADIVQTVFFKASMSIDSYHHNRQKHGSFRAWLWGITRNSINDYFRQMSKSPIVQSAEWIQETTTSLFDWEPNPDRVNSTTTYAHKIIGLIQTDFSETTWQCFWRTVVHGETAANIGDDLGLNAAAVRQAKHRVLRRLQDELDGPRQVFMDEARPGE